MTERIAVYPGSFDPITNGHVNLAERALVLFDKLIVAVAYNPSKAATFSVEERLEMIQAALKNDPRIRVASFQGLLVDFVEKQGVREQCFGPRLDGLAQCPRCGTELDVRLDVGEFHAEEAEEAGEGDPVVEVAGQTVRLRPLTNRDLRCAGADRDRLLARCVVDESAVPVPELLDAVAERLDALDRQAASTVDLDCPSCRTGWAASIDVTEFVWSEVDRFARRLLYDVHTLATAYGWREPDVLAVSPARRRFYLEACAS